MPLVRMPTYQTLVSPSSLASSRSYFPTNWEPSPKKFKASLENRPDACPKFYGGRPVLFAIKAAIEEELDRLEASGVIEKVSHSDWAAPIVAVPKKNGKCRICGDYKVTVNQVLDVDQYPLPTPDQLFATLAGGKKFMTLNLSQAYQQLPLDEEYVTINMHRGLYRCRGCGSGLPPPR